MDGDVSFDVSVDTVADVAESAEVAESVEAAEVESAMVASEVVSETAGAGILADAEITPSMAYDTYQYTQPTQQYAQPEPVMYSIQDGNYAREYENEHPEMGRGIYAAALRDGCPSGPVNPNKLNNNGMLPVKKLLDEMKGGSGTKASSSKVDSILKGIYSSREAFGAQSIFTSESSVPAVSEVATSMSFDSLSMGGGASFGGDGMLP